MSKYLVVASDWEDVEKTLIEAETRSKAVYKAFKLSKITNKFEHYIKYALIRVELIKEKESV